jgi:hypothetical protein
MPAKDKFRDTVKQALVKDDWIITHDPLYIRIGGVEYHIDLAAERLITAEKHGEKIAVEIKSFIGHSATAEFHTALGQYLEYELALEQKYPDHTLYLAVPMDVFETFFALQFIQQVLQRYQVRLLVYNVKDEVIVTWKK